ncbi:MAG: hypothetical protein ACOYWZ_01380 [Bacillota bacterium]
MNQGAVNAYIPRAIQWFEDESNRIKIPKGFKGYIASFAPSIIQAGLLQTMLFYEGVSDKKIVLDCIEAILEKGSLIGKVNDAFHGYYDEKLCGDKLKEAERKLKDFEREIINASIALKLAYRLYYSK